MTDTKRSVKVLCVDDEPSILEGLSLHLRRRYQVSAATSGAEGLEILQRDSTIAVVISDMRMPGMNGATFLQQARKAAPNSVRMLLTGQTDLESAIAAVNQGQIFRFLTKPCQPVTLLVAVEAAAEQHRLITAERVLLEQTLLGSISALTEVLALTNPLAFGRTIRLKQLITELADKLGMTERWQVEVAAMLSQLGCITLPVETQEKVYYGRELSHPEQQMVERLPAVTEQMIGRIPRLEVVRGILHGAAKPFRRAESTAADEAEILARRGAHMLKVVTDFDVLEAEGQLPQAALDIMRGRLQQYDEAVLDALDAARGAASVRFEIRELPLTGLAVGMVFAEDVKLESGALLVARGNQVTERFVERALNIRLGAGRTLVRVLVPQAAAVPA